VSTNKLRIQAYVESNLYQQFENERLSWGVSQSQALERILLERYQHDSGEQVVSTRESVHWTSLVEDLRKRVERLESNLPGELNNNLPGESTSESTSELNNNLPGESTNELPSELGSSLPGELPSELDSSLLGESTNELPSELDSSLPGESTNELPSELDSSLPGELPSESDIDLPGESTNELPSESDIDLPGELPSESDIDLPGESTNKLPSESQKLVVCKLYKNNPKDPQTWRYWAGAKAGFVEDLSKAKTYTEKGSSKVINQLLEDELHKPTSRERISCRALEELTALAAKAENSKPIGLTSEVPSQSVEETLDYRLVVYKFDKGKPYRPEYWRYWAGSKAEFVKDLTTATLYTSEMSAEQMIAQLLEDEMYKPTATERIRWTVLGYLIKLGANYEKVC